MWQLDTKARELYLKQVLIQHELCQYFWGSAFSGTCGTILAAQ